MFIFFNSYYDKFFRSALKLLYSFIFDNIFLNNLFILVFYSYFNIKEININGAFFLVLLIIFELKMNK